MENFTNEELLDVLPSNVKESTELTTKQKVVLGQLYMYNGLEIAKRDGYFFRSNKDLCADCGIQEKTLITAVRRLEALGFIKRKQGARTIGASEYRLDEKRINDYCKDDIEDYSNDYSKQITELTNRIKSLENTVKLLMGRITVIENRNYSTETDTESELDKEIEIDIESNNNIIEKLNDEKLYEQVSNKELTESQLVQKETSTLEQIMQSSTDDEDATCSSDEEQYQQWLQVLEPYVKDIDKAKSVSQLYDIRDKMRDITPDNLNLSNTSPSVLDRLNKHIISILTAKQRQIKQQQLPNEMELADYLRMHRASS